MTSLSGYFADPINLPDNWIVSFNTLNSLSLSCIFSTIDEIIMKPWFVRFLISATVFPLTSTSSMIVNNALLPGAETFTLDTEKLVLGAGDYFKVSCSGTNSISVVVSYLEV